MLRVIRELKDKRIILDFAIGGGIAVLYYVEPLLTYDLILQSHQRQKNRAFYPCVDLPFFVVSYRFYRGF